MSDGGSKTFSEVLDGNVIELDGHRLQVVEGGCTDTADSTGLWVPRLRLLNAKSASPVG